MAEIISVGKSNPGKIKQNPLQSLKEWFFSLDKMVKFSFVFALVISIVSSSAGGIYLSLNSHAGGQGEIRSVRISTDSTDLSDPKNPKINTIITNKEGVHISALAYDSDDSVNPWDPNGKPVNSAFYDWGISSTDSIGTLNQKNNNIVTFIPKRSGWGQLWVKAVGAKTVTRSILVVVRDEDGSMPPMPGPKVTPTPPLISTKTCNNDADCVKGTYVCANGPDLKNLCHQYNANKCNKKPGDRLPGKCISSSSHNSNTYACDETKCPYGPVLAIERDNVICNKNSNTANVSFKWSPSLYMARTDIKPAGYYVFEYKLDNASIWQKYQINGNEKLGPNVNSIVLDNVKANSYQARVTAYTSRTSNKGFDNATKPSGPVIGKINCKNPIVTPPAPIVTITVTPPPPVTRKGLFGAYGIASLGFAKNAKTTGLDYGVNSVMQNTSIGNEYVKTGMKTIFKLSTHIYKRECYRIRQANKGRPGICANDEFKNMSDLYSSDAEFLTEVKAQLEDIKKNSLSIVGGYYVIDDWFGEARAGTGKKLLQLEKQLINKITPGIPTICAFSGGSLSEGTQNEANSSYVHAALDNFSPEACDYVAIYTYADARKTPLRINQINWSMPTFVSRIKSYLKTKGWNPKKTPLIGIPQSFGGKYANTGLIRPMPTTQSIKAQSLGWCKQGAVGLLYFKWDGSAPFVFPQTSTAMKEGIKQGVAACRALLN